MVAGFYDDAKPPSETDLALLDELDLHEETMKKSYDISSFNLGLTGQAAKRAVFSPTANIAGLSSGYELEGPKTVIPAMAMAKMDFRLVPDQDPDDILSKVRRHLDEHGFGDVEVKHLGGERPAQTPVSDPFVQLTIETAREVYGSEPRVTPMIGGSGPVHPFRKFLNVPIVTLGTGYPEALAHAPNENIRIEDFIRGTRHMAALLQHFPYMTR